MVKKAKVLASVSAFLGLALGLTSAVKEVRRVFLKLFSTIVASL
jgi:hypothetical protein